MSSLYNDELIIASGPFSITVFHYYLIIIRIMNNEPHYWCSVRRWRDRSRA